MFRCKNSLQLPPLQLAGSCIGPPLFSTMQQKSSTQEHTLHLNDLIFRSTGAIKVSSTLQQFFDPKQGAAKRYNCSRQRIPNMSLLHEPRHVSGVQPIQNLRSPGTLNLAGFPGPASSAK